ncbi:flagellar export chaperone FliS [Helicovermis profundi]|uniref:Flagellar protein FliS n=1 Tax=Helicovermis profundi TaxID=3065157 RepID=A0AAU9EPW3_9FIRM|nr:hypothetical protein HLPR_25250 [Clostridia bacterium S502]
MAMVNPYNYKKPNNAKVDEKPIQKLRVVNSKVKYNKSANYLEQKVMSAKPEELTFMLYEGMVRFLKQVKLYNDQKKYEKSNFTNQRVQAIITELRVTLDMSYDVSNNLESLYIFMNERLVDANLEKDNKIVDEVLFLAVELKETWEKAMKLV